MKTATTVQGDLFSRVVEIEEPDLFGAPSVRRRIVQDSPPESELVFHAQTLSSGTIGAMTGFSRYDDIDPVHTAFIAHCRTSRAATWQEAWKDFAKLHNLSPEPPAPQTSRGHCCFAGVFEYFLAPSGDLYRAERSNVLGLDGYRLGARIEAVAPRAAEVLARLQNKSPR